MDFDSAALIATSLKYIAVGLCMIPMGGVATGIGVMFGALVTEMSRNPAAKGTLFTYTLIGFALAEAAGLYAFVVAFIILFS
ncbi:MAG: ATP synthase subunit C family protein [Alphaproteobacteria bacterium]|nr:ATP synthase subunit C family protein [Alphaproteobacteria bacterium]